MIPQQILRSEIVVKHSPPDFSELPFINEITLSIKLAVAFRLGVAIN
jgi:hypothetical protein